MAKHAPLVYSAFSGTTQAAEYIQLWRGNYIEGEPSSVSISVQINALRFTNTNAVVFFQFTFINVVSFLHTRTRNIQPHVPFLMKGQPAVADFKHINALFSKKYQSVCYSTNFKTQGPFEWGSTPWMNICFVTFFFFQPPCSSQDDNELFIAVSTKKLYKFNGKTTHFLVLNIKGATSNWRSSNMLLSIGLHGWLLLFKCGWQSIFHSLNLNIDLLLHYICFPDQKKVATFFPFSSVIMGSK